MAFAWKTPSCFLLFLAVVFSAGAQDAPEIEVQDVRFTRVAGNWLAAQITLRSGKNPSPTAIDEDYLDDVRLQFYTCFEVDRGGEGDEFVFYNSEVRIVSMDRQKTYQLAFFLPEVVRERDDLDTDPFAWVIQMEAASGRIPVQEDQFDGDIRTESAYENFLSKANSEGSVNDGILLPIYLAPYYIVNDTRINLRDVPAFYRFEGRN